MQKSELPSVTIARRCIREMRDAVSPDAQVSFVSAAIELAVERVERERDDALFALKETQSEAERLQREIEQERAGRAKAEARVAELEARPRSLLRDPVGIDLSKVTPEQLARGAAVHRALREPCTVHNLDERGVCIKCERRIRPHVPDGKDPP